MRCFKITLSIIALLAIVSCSSNKKAKPDSSIPPKYAITSEPQFVKNGELSFVLHDSIKATIDYELADTDAKREQGLMYRRSMKQNQGMLFIFDKEERQNFWMKNTHLALDIIFVNEAKEIVHIAYDCAPYSLKSIPSYEYAKYVVEVVSGYCKQQGIQIGDSIKF